MTTTSEQRTEWLRQARHSHDAEWEFVAIEHMGLHIDALEAQLAAAQHDARDQGLDKALDEALAACDREYAEALLGIPPEGSPYCSGVADGARQCYDRIRALRTPAGEPPEPPAPATPEIVRDLLLLVMEENQPPPPLEEIGRWTQVERDLVADWAGTYHAKASDNPISVPPRPPLLDEWFVPPAEGQGGEG